MSFISYTLHFLEEDYKIMAPDGEGLDERVSQGGQGKRGGIRRDRVREGISDGNTRTDGRGDKGGRYRGKGLESNGWKLMR